MEAFDIWVGRNLEGNEIRYIQLMVVGKLDVELGGCLHFDIGDDHQRQALAETFRRAADLLRGEDIT
jgi:hypothetical protein